MNINISCWKKSSDFFHFSPCQHFDKYLGSIRKENRLGIDVLVIRVPVTFSESPSSVPNKLKTMCNSRSRDPTILFWPYLHSWVDRRGCRDSHPERQQDSLNGRSPSSLPARKSMDSVKVGGAGEPQEGKAFWVNSARCMWTHRVPSNTHRTLTQDSHTGLLHRTLTRGSAPHSLFYGF